MANEDQYIHPIIQAMLEAHQQIQGQQQLAANIANQQAQREAEQQRIKIEQQRADLANRQLEQEHEIQSKRLEEEHNVNQGQLALNKLHAQDIIRQSILAGMNPGALATGGNAPQQVPGIVGGTPDTRFIDLGPLGKINIADLPTREQLTSQEVDLRSKLVGAEATGKLTAEEPFKKSEFGREMTKQESQQEFQKSLKQAELDWDKIKTNLDNNTRLKVAGIEAATANRRTELEYGVTPEQRQAGLYGLATGQIQPNMTNPIDRGLTTAALAAGYRLPNKNDAAAFENLGSMNDVYKKIEDLADLLPDEKKLGKGAAVASAAGEKFIVGTSLPTDLQNKINELNPSVYPIVHNVQGFIGNRLNTQDMALITNGMSGVKTKQQMQDYEQSLKDTVDNRITNVLQVGMPREQQNMLHHATGVTPAWIIQARQSNPNAKNLESQGYKLNVDKSVEKNQVVYDPPGVQ